MIASILHLSTSHLKPETWEAMPGLNPYPIIFTCPEEEWGMIVRVCVDDLDADNEEFPMPEDLLACMTYAAKRDCGYIRFDRDIPVINDLPTYDWE